MSVNLRPVISVVLSAALAMAPLRSAHAEEIGSPSSSSERIDEQTPSTSARPLGASTAPNILALTASALSLAPTVGSHLSPMTTSKLDLVAPTDIRLSRGAKTAIIVTAIVVGVLLIAGVVVLAKPHKP